MEKRSSLYALLVFGGLLALCFVFLFALLSAVGPSRGEPAWGGGKGPRIAVIEVNGVITDAKKVVGLLRQVRKDKDLLAVVVRIDSPGGAVAPSQEIYEAIQRARKEKKVVCSLGTVAASGGYYIAAACDKIVASPGTITGSIGVISQYVHVQDLLRWAKLEVDTIKAGALKDVGSPFRDMSEAERAYLQKFVDGIHDQFIRDVAKARHLDEKELRKVADGRILTGEEAQRLGLVDALGNLEAALDEAAGLAGHKPGMGDPVPVFQGPREGGLVQELFRGAVESARPRQTVEARDPRW
jgi:protease-4